LSDSDFSKLKFQPKVLIWNGISALNPTFLNYENRALTSSSFRPKPKTANRDELAENASRPVFIVGVGDKFFHSCRQKNM